MSRRLVLSLAFLAAMCLAIVVAGVSASSKGHLGDPLRIPQAPPSEAAPAAVLELHGVPRTDTPSPLGPESVLAKSDAWVVYGLVRLPSGMAVPSIRWAFSRGANVAAEVEIHEIPLQLAQDGLYSFRVEGPAGGTCWLDIAGKPLLGAMGSRMVPGDRRDLGIVDCSILPVRILATDSAGLPCTGITLTVRGDTAGTTHTLISASDGSATVETERFDVLYVAVSETDQFLGLAERAVPISSDREVSVKLERKSRVRVTCVTASGDEILHPAIVTVWRDGSAVPDHGFPRSTIDGWLRVSPGRLRVGARVEAILGAYGARPVDLEVSPGTDTEVRLVCKPKETSGLARIRFAGPGLEQVPPPELHLVVERLTAEGAPDPSAPQSDGRPVAGLVVTCPLLAGRYRAQYCYFTSGILHCSEWIHLHVSAGTITDYSGAALPYGAVRIAPTSGMTSSTVQSLVLRHPHSASTMAVIDYGSQVRFRAEGEFAWPGATKEVRIWLPAGSLALLLQGAKADERWKGEITLEPGVVRDLPVGLPK